MYPYPYVATGIDRQATLITCHLIFVPIHTISTTLVVVVVDRKIAAGDNRHADDGE